MREGVVGPVPAHLVPGPLPEQTQLLLQLPNLEYTGPGLKGLEERGVLMGVQRGEGDTGDYWEYWKYREYIEYRGIKGETEIPTRDIG